MTRLHFGHFQQRDVGLDRLQARTAALHVQLAAGAQFPPGFGELLGVAQIDQGALGHRDALLGTAQFEVVAGHFGGDGDLCIGEVVLLGAEVGARCFGGTALAAEQIKLPAGIEAELVAFAEDTLATEGGIRLLATVVTATTGDVRQLVQALLDEHRAGLTHARHRDAQVQVGAQCFMHQLLQHRVIELGPPARHRRGGGEHRRGGALQAHRLGRRRLVVGADADAAGQQRAGHGHGQQTDHHGSTSPR